MHTLLGRTDFRKSRLTPTRLNTATALGCLLLVACCPLLFGCGQDGPEVVSVKGKVTLGGGPWPKPGVLYFTPVKPAEGMPSRPAPAHFDTDGNFTVTSFREGDGLVPGMYKVGVECWEVPPSMETNLPGKSYVPEKFQSPQTSGLEITIQPGAGKQTPTFDIPKP